MEEKEIEHSADRYGRDNNGMCGKNNERNTERL